MQSLLQEQIDTFRSQRMAQQPDPLPADQDAGVTLENIEDLNQVQEMMQESSDNLKLNNGPNTLSSRAHNFNTRLPAVQDNDYAPNNHNSIFASNSI